VDFALACASRGARVFQLPPDGSEATFDQGDDATTDHETILARWREYPGRRVGISAEDTLIIRVTERADSKHVEQFGMWLNEHAPAPTLRTFRSDVSGKRPKIEICIFYKLPAGSQVEGRSSLFAEGIEVLESEATVVGPCPPTDNGKCEFYSPHPMARRARG
jgi:hypothetical protein